MADYMGEVGEVGTSSTIEDNYDEVKVVANTNPLYCNTTYFLSSQYDDKILTDFYVNAANESYSRVVRTQERLSTTGEWYGTLADFKVDKSINSKYGFSSTTISTIVPDYILDIKNLKIFARENGKIYDIPVRLEDIPTKSNLFNYIYEFQIDTKTTFNVYLVTTRYRHTIIAFDPSDNNLKTITDDMKWFLARRDITTIIKTTQTISKITVTNTTVTDGTVLKIPGDDDSYIYKTIKSSSTQNYNSWDIYAGKNNLYSSMSCYLYKVDNDGYLYFVVDLNFINYLDSITTLDIDLYFIHRPNRHKCIHFTNEDDNTLITQVGYLNNPVGQKNIMVYEYDKNDYRKLNRISTSDVKFFVFPDIYDFSELQYGVDNDLFIEIYEYDNSYDLFTFDNHLIDFIDSTDSDYRQIAINSSTILNYKPYLYTIDMDKRLEDFMSSPYSNDLRGYLLDQMQKFLETDSYEFNKLTKYIDKLNGKYLTYSGSLEELNVVSYPADDEGNTIDVHGVKFKSHKTMSPTIMYVNGSLILPYEIVGVDAKNSDQFICYYTDADFYTDNYTRYGSIDKTTVDPITVDLFYNSSNNNDDNYGSSYTFNSVDDVKRLLNELDVDNLCLSDLVFYNGITADPYTLSQFTFMVDVEELTVKSLEKDVITVIDEANTIDYLCTLLEEYYATMNQSLIIVNSGNSQVSSDEVNTGTSTTSGVDLISNKILNFDNISFKINDTSLLSSPIIVSNVNKLYTYTFYGSDLTDDIYYTIAGVSGDISIDRYEVYLNGTLLNSDQVYVRNSGKIGGDIILSFNMILDAADVVTVLHTPIKFKTIDVPIRDRILKPNFLSENNYDGLVDEIPTWSGNSLTIDLTDIEDIINFDIARVFINGARVSLDKQKEYKVTNILHFTEDEVNNKIKKLNFYGKEVDDLNIEDIRLIIKYPYRDLDIYNMNTNTIENQLLFEYCNK